MSQWLREVKGKKVTLSSPQRGAKSKIMEMAANNARAALLDRLERLSRNQGVMAELKARLYLEKIPRRLECFDLAHLQGEAAVAGMVVMEEGEWKKEAYRRFKIKEAKGGDDYGGMREVIRRRFSKDIEQEAWARPDLLLIDGGRGQLTAVMSAFRDLSLSPPPLAGIAKDRDGGGPDRIFLYGRKNPADLKPGSAALLVLSRLRDEAHRYCRTYHHGLRSKDMLESVFSGLRGLGPMRRKALTEKYPALEDLQAASDADILRLAPIPLESLAALRNSLKKLLDSKMDNRQKEEAPLEEEWQDEEEGYEKLEGTP
jgi:excinuclease ABC subunit C